MTMEEMARIIGVSRITLSLIHIQMCIRDRLYAMKENYPDITPYAFAGKITDGNYTNFLLSYVSRENERDNYIYEPTFTTCLLYTSRCV